MATATTKGKRHTRTKSVAHNNNNNIMSNAVKRYIKDKHDKAISESEDMALAFVNNMHFNSVKQFMSSLVMLDHSTRTLCKMSKRVIGVNEIDIIGFEYVEVVVKRYSGNAGQPAKLFKIRIPIHLIK